VWLYSARSRSVPCLVPRVDTSHCYRCHDTDLVTSMCVSCVRRCTPSHIQLLTLKICVARSPIQNPLQRVPTSCLYESKIPYAICIRSLNHAPRHHYIYTNDLTVPFSRTYTHIHLIRAESKAEASTTRVCDRPLDTYHASVAWHDLTNWRRNRDDDSPSSYIHIYTYTLTPTRVVA
jgi:hypothetical protein